MENQDAHSADFRQFFLTHYETLCVRAFRLVHDRKLSEDIVQDVFLMLWERREEIDFSRPVLPYLMTAVRNRSIDFLRSRKLHGDGTCGLDTLDGYVRRLVADRCEDEFDLSQLRHEIDDGVSQLSEQCRRVFLLSRETGLKNREIAEQLNISVKAVEKHIGVALSKLRLRLSRSGFFSLFFLTACSFFAGVPSVPAVSLSAVSHMARARSCGRALFFLGVAERPLLFISGETRASGSPCLPVRRCGP